MSKFPYSLPNLRIERLVARGGSSSVYAALDTRHNRWVAVKFLDVDSSTGRDNSEAFTRELQAMGRLSDHPFVVDLYDSGLTKSGIPYLVMPLVSAGSVAERMERGDVFTLDEILECGVKLASAIETAHRRGVLHCDIKPSNVFLDPYDSPLLGDLGIASIADAHGTRSGSSSLTILYAPPEVLNDVQYSVQSDVYSLGATLFAMTDLRPPYTGETPEDLVGQISSASEPPNLRRDVPAGLSALLAQMMAIDPEQRPASAAETIVELQTLQRELTGSQTPATIGTHDVEDLGTSGASFDYGDDVNKTVEHLELAPTIVSEPRMNRPLIAAAAIAIIAVVIAVGYLGRPMPSDIATEAPTGDAAEVLEVLGEVEDVEPVEETDAPTPSDATAPAINCDEWFVPPEIDAADVESATTLIDYSVRRAPDVDTACERGVLLPANSEVEIHGVLEDDWRYTFNPETNDWGWIHSSAFGLDINCADWYVPLASELVETAEMLTTTDYNVRRAPDVDTACERGVLLRAGTVVEIHAVRPDWKYVYNAAIDDWGWVHDEAFTESIDCSEWSTPEEDEEISPVSQTTISDYEVRRAPGHDEACGRGVIISAGTEIDVHAVRGDWSWTHDPAADDWGWINASALPATIDCTAWYSPLDEEKVTIYREITAVGTIVNRAPADDVACERGVRLEPGTAIEVHAERGEWRYTYHPEADDWGWVHERTFSAS